MVLPTDTVYGIAADAFQAEAVVKLQEAKKRGRDMPPPVLISNTSMLRALCATVPEALETLAERFWPGALTIIVDAQPSLQWDLGESAGTVALRLPACALTQEIIAEVGPLAVSSANVHGEPPARTAAEAVAMLGHSVEVYLELGATETSGVSSTIVDARALTAQQPQLTVLRTGTVTLSQLQEALPEVEVIHVNERATA